MQNALSHRGPDAASFSSQIYKSQKVFLGSSRLKIVDKDNNSNQPFVSQDGRYHLIFNGEIYNHADLKNDLIERGYSFRTHSDTETLLYHLIEYQTSKLHLLNGMFAFLFYDSISGEATVVRDRFGIKPLYKFENESYIIISSEIRSILASGLVDAKIEDEEIHQYLTFGHTSRSGSMIKGINEIVPGSVIKISDNSTTIECIAIPPARHTSDLHELLSDAIVSQIPDVPFGLFLSGGVDSTLILALLKEIGNHDFQTFTLGNKANGTKDLSFASKAAKQYGADHRSFEISETDLELFPEFLESLDDPMADSGAFMTWILAKKAKEAGAKVILSGSGADELFAGYSRHVAFSKYLKYKSAFVRLKRFGQPIVNNWPNNSWFPLSAKASQASKFFNAIDSDPSKTYLGFVAAAGFVSPAQTELEGTDSWLKNALKHDRENYLVKDVLAVGDRMAMMHGLEMRVPFLDNDVANYADCLADDELVKNGAKTPLKNLLISLGGHSYCQRKEGFGMPTKHWLTHSGLFVQLLREAISLDLPLLRSEVSEKKLHSMLRAHQAGKKDYSLQLWSYLVMAKWMQKHFS